MNNWFIVLMVMMMVYLSHTGHELEKDLTACNAARSLKKEAEETKPTF